MNNEAIQIAQTVRDAGGRAIMVGGAVRDAIFGLPSKDIDLEIFGLEAEELEICLSHIGTLDFVGKSFGVYRIHGIDIDISLPRRDSKTGAGHRGFSVSVDPHMDFREAARRRDFTINAIGQDPLNGELLDPHSGQSDCRKKILRVVDAEHFGEDPLRALRACQFVARFGLQVDEATLTIIQQQSIGELSCERIHNELRKLLLNGRQIDAGIRLLHESGIGQQLPGWETYSNRDWRDCATVCQRLRNIAPDRQNNTWEGMFFAAFASRLQYTCSELWPRHEEDVPKNRALANIFKELMLPTSASRQALGILALHSSFRHPGEDADLLHSAWLSSSSCDIRYCCDLAEALFPADDKNIQANRQRASALGCLNHKREIPISGKDLIAAGINPGPGIGAALFRAREFMYAHPDCSREDLLSTILTP